jgi:NSS family neurotransmitter:Na+ symporter
MSPAPTGRAHWSSGAAFFFVAAGLAIGLGNIWRFPFLAGQYGGGAFVLVYVAAVFAFGVPIMIGEIMLGRAGGGGPGESIRKLSAGMGLAPVWRLIGWLGLFIPFVGVAYYSVVAGWVVDYAVNFILSGGLDGATSAAHQARFDAMLESPLRLLASHAAFMFLVVAVAARGVNRGLEKSAKALMPALFLLLAGLAVYASTTGAFGRAFAFLFAPDFSKLSGEAVSAACGQAFFSLGIGLGALMTFGAYLPKDVSIVRVASAVAAADTGVALLAGLVVFPITFAFGVDPAVGPGLVFVTMPAAFAAMPAGYVVGGAFFLLVFIAAFTTGIATIEPVVAWLEQRGLSRPTAALAAGIGAWIVGAAAALSFNTWSDVRLAPLLPTLADKSIFDLLDFAISTLLLPLNGLLAALFAGWALAAARANAELRAPAPAFRLWRWSIRFVAPLCIALALWAAAFF